MTTGDLDEETAHHLRETRTRHGLTLAEVAERIGVSTTHMSRLERGQRQPSIGVLRQLAAVYQVGIGELVGENAAAQRKIVRADAPPHLEETDDGPYATLTGLVGHSGLGVVQLDITDDDGRHQVRRHEDEEWIYILRGELKLELGAEHITLRTGDSIHFDARTPHRLMSAVSTSTRILIVCAPSRTPPTNGHI
ncbi:helix-turn-helix domain-containing protein [Rhodococcus jostii]|uniref:helix-turn-helix domain-containing protein n=1 Tax=Rhodococcus jostii TaxID=132919 RepID=UPI00093314D8